MVCIGVAVGVRVSLFSRHLRLVLVARMLNNPSCHGSLPESTFQILPKVLRLGSYQSSIAGICEVF